MLLFSSGNAVPYTEMSTKTTTAVTHYHIQKKRRAEFIEEWRNYRQSVIRKEDVKLEKTARGLRSPELDQPAVVPTPRQPAAVRRPDRRVWMPDRQDLLQCDL